MKTILILLVGFFDGQGRVGTEILHGAIFSRSERGGTGCSHRARALALWMLLGSARRCRSSASDASGFGDGHRLDDERIVGGVAMIIGGTRLCPRRLFSAGRADDAAVL